jgi:putative transposase
MVGYRRNFIPGGTYFFTVTLADRRSNALVDHIGALRGAFRTARRERPFAIEAVVILPDHLHAISSLPPNDADFPGRWRRIKGHFSRALIDAGIEQRRRPNGDLALWQKRFWEHSNPQRKRLCPACRLHPFQPNQTCSRAPRVRLAAFLVSPLCKGGTVAR